jgi:hypothetical protein
MQIHLREGVSMQSRLRKHMQNRLREGRYKEPIDRRERKVGDE